MHSSRNLGAKIRIYFRRIWMPEKSVHEWWRVWVLGNWIHMSVCAWILWGNLRERWAGAYLNHFSEFQFLLNSFFVVETHCDPNPCSNGARCTNYPDRFECICPIGYKGLRCDSKETISVGKYICIPQHWSCNTSWLVIANHVSLLIACHSTLTMSLTVIRICDRDPCANRALCSETSDFDFQCKCPAGFEGKICDQGIFRVQ